LNSIKSERLHILSGKQFAIVYTSSVPLWSSDHSVFLFQSINL